MGLKCMVIDDDALIREQVGEFCKRLDFIEFCLKVESSISALSLLSAGHYDLIFLDLNMPDMKGSELIKHLKKENQVVVISSDPSFAVEAFDYNVVGYLLKPFDFGSFYKVLSKLQTTSEASEKEFLFVKDGRSLVRITLAELSYVKSESNYVRFVCTGSKTLALMKLGDLVEELPSNFIRVHRSYIVNINAIEKINNDSIEVQGDEIPLGQSYKELLLKKLEGFK